MKQLLLVLACVTAVACSNTPAAPTPAPAPTPPAPVIPACQANHTATIAFHNNGSKTVDVIVDGGVLENVGVGATSPTLTVAANVAHNIQFRITNTNIFPCGPFNPIPIECGTTTYGTCTGF